MFPLEASGKPGRDYPRIGPTTSQPCSIDAGGNIFLQGGGNTNNVSNQKGAHTNTAARNRPRLLLAGRGSESGRANHHLSTVVCRRKKRSARGTPNTGTSGSKGNNSRLDTAGGHRGDGRLDTADGDHWGGGRLDTVVGRHQGANMLRHAGGVLRCRSVYHASGSSHTPAPRSRSSINNSVADIIDTTTTTAAAVVARDNKPKLLRAYSAPLFLHSTSFPPKSRAHSACGIKAPATTTGGDDDGRTTSSRIIRHQTPAAASNHGSCCGNRAQTSPHGDNEKLRQENNNTSAGAVAVAVAAAGAGAGAGGGAGAGAGAAPCRHRRRGYLHRYMGFVQEKVSSPPLESFRALGGLRDFPLKKESSASAAVVGRKLAGHDNAAAATAAAAAASVNPATEEAAATPEPPGGDRRCSLSNNSPERSYGGRQCSAAAAGGGGGDGPSGTTPVSPKEACPLELLADGSSSLAPITPPNNAVQIIPAWCSRSKKKRPEGANRRKKSWEADSRRGSSHPNRDAPKNKPTGSSSLVASLVACKSKTRRKKRAGSPYLKVGVLLPYDLERPVSPERAEAFHYTCN